MPAYRSFLFAPGNHARKVAKVFDCGADNVILDLEDAVAKAEKVATRARVVEALKRPHKGGAYIRVNAFNTEFCYGDAVAVVGPGLDGIILPMVESREQIAAFDWLVGALERERGLPPGGVDIIPIIETAKGIAHARAIAAAGTRVKRMAFGAGDYTLDVNMEWTLAESELEHARAEMVVASRTAGLEAPIDTVWVHINDLEGLASSAKRARQLGFQGKMCIYPPQVERVNAAFTPTETEIAFARRVVAAFEKAERDGSSSIQLDGFFIDYPIVYKAQRTLDLVRAADEATSSP
ncbi:MAG: CoA ester lyase [Reyranella sp.]|uniref:HpcH/HpaI aldolase/citrate lyase family protein n=1 Tax=Reyranella sp. TaxID=1929291 RepID=UPI001AC6351C|nr:CoA ester lyase [Reyranella sp.]MBN9090409.1 CoA ester lyase [Reyranella sp.]